jgi:hypothetical protein
MSATLSSHVINELPVPAGGSGDAKIGRVHLRVAYLECAINFYRDVLGSKVKTPAEIVSGRFSDSNHNQTSPERYFTFMTCLFRFVYFSVTLNGSRQATASPV